VANGNDGNYFQHSIEVAVAARLAATDPGRRLHVAFAHGMAPFETCGNPPAGQSRGLLERALTDRDRRTLAHSKEDMLGHPRLGLGPVMRGSSKTDSRTQRGRSTRRDARAKRALFECRRHHVSEVEGVVVPRGSVGDAETILLSCLDG